MKDDAIKMLQLMGVPVIVAPCEAEAQCAALCKAGKVYATVTEDMDALTFQTKVLLRGLNTKKEPVVEISYDQMLTELELSHNEFVDLCILCGCDYTDTIQGVSNSSRSSHSDAVTEPEAKRKRISECGPLAELVACLRS